MKLLKYVLSFTFVLAFVLIIAACAQQPPAPSSATGGSTNSSSGANNGSAALLRTATAKVKGTSQTILTNAQGMTLYYFKPDTQTASKCSGNCAQTWPALLAPSSQTPTSSSTLPGTLSAHQTANGNQVAYNGHFLYTFSGDSAPGDTNGEGIGGQWFVATPALH